MPYDMPLAPHNTLSGVRPFTQVGRYPQFRTARPSTNGVPPTGADDVRPIEPMLLVHQEQVETFRLIAAALRRGLKALARSYAT
jgi:hypothetical protein